MARRPGLRTVAKRAGMALAVALLLAPARGAWAQTPGATTPGATTPGATTPGATTPGAGTTGAEMPGATKPDTMAPDAMAPAGPAADSTAVSIAGRVAHPRSIVMAELETMPAASVELDVASGHGEQHATYKGVLVWTLLEAAGPVDEPGRKTFLQHSVLARGQDGYAVALAIGEMDPKFEGKQVLVAYARDGKPLPSLTLVVPGDRKAGRSVKDLAGLEVR